jgi:hypothetical protein
MLAQRRSAHSEAYRSKQDAAALIGSEIAIAD